MNESILTTILEKINETFPNKEDVYDLARQPFDFNEIETHLRLHLNYDFSVSSQLMEDGGFGYILTILKPVDNLSSIDFVVCRYSPYYHIISFPDVIKVLDGNGFLQISDIIKSLKAAGFELLSLETVDRLKNRRVEHLKDLWEGETDSAYDLLFKGLV